MENCAEYEFSCKRFVSRLLKKLSNILKINFEASNRFVALGGVGGAGNRGKLR